MRSRLLDLLLYFLLLCFVQPRMALSQPGRSAFAQDSLLAIKYFNIADTSWTQVDTCLRYSRLAIPLLKKTGQWEKYIHCLAGMSYCFNVKEQYDSMEINNRLAYEEAQRYLTTDSYIYSAVINNLGAVYSNVRQDYNKAIAYYQTALELIDSTNTHDAVKGTLLKNMGDVYLKKGDFERAILYFQEALIHFEAIYSYYVQKHTTSYFKIAEVYQSLARVHQYQRNYPAAIRYLQDMLRLMDRNAQDFHTGYYAYCYTQLAEIAIEQHRLDAAADYLRRVSRLPGLSPQQQAETDHLYSRFYLAQGALAQAQSHADRALQLMPPTKRINRAAILHVQGLLYYNQQAYQKALDAFSAAIAQLVPNGDLSPPPPHLNPQWEILSRIDLIEQLQAMARCYEARYDQQPHSELLEKSLHCYLLISGLSDQLRQNYQSEETKIFLSEMTYPHYEAGIETALRLYQIHQHKEYLEQAFYFFEKSKAAVLLEELRAREAEGIYSIPVEWSDRAHQIKVDIFYYRKLLAGSVAKKDTEKAREWNSRLLELTRLKEALQEQIRQQYPHYTALIQGTVPSLASLQKALPTGTAAIEYFLGKKNAYLFFLTKDTIACRSIGDAEQIPTRVQNLLRHLKMNGRQDLDTFAQTAYALYRQTVGNLSLPQIDHLLIIPDGELSYLPFELLLTSKPTDERPKHFDYLIKEYPISYAYSFSLWQIQEQHTPSGGEALVIAPVFADDPARYLRYSDTDIEAFSNIRHTILKHEEATIDNFLHYAPQSNMVYFSTHATAGEGVKAQPSIDFIDQRLYLSDLYALSLPIHLVVLSACESGTGEQRRGEGVMSLARGFTYAGVPSVMTTLWKVNEKATHTIVQGFYKYLTTGLSKSESLRRAKIDYLQDCEDMGAAPYYWAGFVMIGNTHPFTLTKSRSWMGISLTIALLLLVLSFIWVRFNKL